MQYSTVLIAIDPDTKKQAAAFGHIDVAKPNTAVIESVDPLEVLREFGIIFRGFRNGTLVKLVVEDQYYARNIKTFKQLVEVRAMLETVGNLMGYEIMPPVHPKTWGVAIGCEARERRLERKERSKRVASVVVDRKIEDHNVADAINIWCYAREGLLCPEKK